MGTLDFVSGWLKSRHIDYSYDQRADVVSFLHIGIRLSIFILPEHNLFVVSHTERMLYDVISQEEAEAIVGTLQSSTFTRPVPREDLHKIKFKVVSGQIPEDITKWLDTAANDISTAVYSYRSYLSNNPNSIKQCILTS